MVVSASRARRRRGRSRRRRRDRLRPGGRPARSRARLREGAGRLQLLVRVLRDPARARYVAQPAGRARPRGDRRRVQQGHREVVLTGINLGCYRDREAGYDLPRLVREAGATPGLARLRLSSIEVNHVSDELVAALRETPTVGRHLHVPLQSGDDRVLRAMGRRYDVATFLRRARRRSGLQPHDRRDRRLPRRRRARRSQHAERGRRGRDHEGARLSVLAAAGHANRGSRHRRRARRRRSAARACGRSRESRLAHWRAQDRRATTSCSSIAPAAATATTTRRGSSTGRSASSSASAAAR